MARNARWLGAGVAFAALLLHVSHARACDVPVFRYAMEHWMPSPYPVILFHKGPLAAPEKALVARLRSAADGQVISNVEVMAVDTEGSMSPEVQKLWKAQTKAKLPWMVVLFPPETGNRAPVWAGPAGTADVSRMLDSPKRREVVRRLADGSAAVYVLLESGDRKKDDAAAAKLRDGLRKIQTEILPVDEEAGAAGTGGGKGPRPLFTVIRVSRTDPAERFFATMLLQTDPNLAGVTEPITFPIFGQGRALCALAGKEISQPNLEDVTAFLVGDCSCEVKHQNPGTDLLVTANWYSVLNSQPGEGPTLPSLATLPEPAAAVTTKAPAAEAPVTAPAEPAKRAAAPEVAAAKTTAPASAPTPTAAGTKVAAKPAAAVAEAPSRSMRPAPPTGSRIPGALGSVKRVPAPAVAKPATKAAGAPAKGASAAKPPKPGATPTPATAAKPGTTVAPAAAKPEPNAAPPATAGPEAVPAASAPTAGASETAMAAVPPVPVGEQPSAAPPAPPAGEPVPAEAPAAGNRLVVSVGVALILGLALAAVAPRLLMRRNRGPRRPV